MKKNNLTPTGGGRNELLDSIKCCLIFLVVLGHVLLTTDSYYSDRVIKAAISWIWFFHMPAFAIISGYFFNPDVPKTKLVNGVYELLTTYIIMQIVLTVIYGPYDIKNALLVPQYAMWYLIALPSWRVFSFLLRKITDKLWLTIIIGIIMCLVSGFIPISYLGFQRICSFFPFFSIGCLFREHNIIEKYRHKYATYAIVLLILLFVCFLIPDRTICSGMCNVPYKSILQLFTRASVLVFGLIMSICFFWVIPNKKNLALIGKNTLFVYCYHVFFILGVMPNLWAELGIVPNFLYCLLYSLTIFILLGIASRVKLLNRLIKPF